MCIRSDLASAPISLWSWLIEHSCKMSTLFFLLESATTQLQYTYTHTHKHLQNYKPALVATNMNVQTCMYTMQVDASTTQIKFRAKHWCCPRPLIVFTYIYCTQLQFHASTNVCIYVILCAYAYHSHTPMHSSKHT